MNTFTPDDRPDGTVAGEPDFDLGMFGGSRYRIQPLDYVLRAGGLIANGLGYDDFEEAATVAAAHASRDTEGIGTVIVDTHTGMEYTVTP